MAERECSLTCTVLVRMTYMALDQNVVVTSPAGVFRVLSDTNLIGRHKKNQPLQPAQ